MKETVLIDDGKDKVTLNSEVIKEQRVVLNLTTDQAKELKHFCDLDGVSKGSTFEHYGLALEVSTRLNKTILKQAFIARCQADGIGKPTKEAMKNFMEGLK